MLDYAPIVGLCQMLTPRVHLCQNYARHPAEDPIPDLNCRESERKLDRLPEEGFLPHPSVPAPAKAPIEQGSKRLGRYRVDRRNLSTAQVSAIEL